jgi:uncharacterized protein (DUF1778 family)
MSAVPGRKEHPLSMRLPKSDIDIIDHAARLRGRSRTDFIREAAVRAAEATILDQSPIRMSAEGFRSFVEALSAEPKPVTEMVEILRRPAPWEDRV